MKRKHYLYILLAFTNFNSVCCQSQDASPAGIMISHSHPKNGWMASYTYMNMYMNTNLSGSSKATDETIWNNYIFTPHNMQMNMHMIMGMYGATGRFSIMAMVNYINCSMDLKLPPGTILVHHHGDSSMNIENGHSHVTSGFGDMKLWAIYKLMNGEGSSLVVSGGINIPTGKFDIAAGEHAINEGERHPYMMQLGTGTLDLMPGLTYYKRNNKLSWSLQAITTFRPFYNSIGYHYGNEFNVNAWAAFQFSSFISASTRLEGIYSEAIQGRDPLIFDGNEPDASPKNYGGRRLSGYFGLNYYFNKRFMNDSKIVFEFGIPFYQNLNGPQLANQHTLHVGITKSF